LENVKKDFGIVITVKMISTQLLSTASRTVWRSEENARWTSSRTECLQLSHSLVCTIVLDLQGECSIDDLDEYTRYSRTR